MKDKKYKKERLRVQSIKQEKESSCVIVKRSTKYFEERCNINLQIPTKNLILSDIFYRFFLFFK